MTKNKKAEPKSTNARLSSPGVRRHRLTTLGGLRRGLARVVRELEDGTRDTQTGRVLVCALSVLANVITTEREQNELGPRAAELEARLGANPSAAKR